MTNIVIKVFSYRKLIISYFRWLIKMYNLQLEAATLLINTRCNIQLPYQCSTDTAGNVKCNMPPGTDSMPTTYQRWIDTDWLDLKCVYSKWYWLFATLALHKAESSRHILWIRKYTVSFGFWRFAHNTIWLRWMNWRLNETSRYD